MRSIVVGSILLGLLTTGPTNVFGGGGNDTSTGTVTKPATPTEVSRVRGPGDSSPAPEDATSEIAVLKQMLQQQAAQYEEQRTVNAELQIRLTKLENALAGAPGLSAAPPTIAAAASTAAPTTAPIADGQKSGEPKADAAPLFFKIGRVKFTPGGFLDLTTVFRSKTVGSGIGTTFGTIPYNVSASYPAAGLSELRLSEQNTRLSLRVDSEIGSAKVFGVVETDFLGNNATTMDVISNSATLRIRLAFIDVTKGKWEFLGGQAWSLITPNRTGLSPLTSDVFYSLDSDANYQLGVPWARQAQVRVVYHPNSSWAIGFSAENPQQYIGSALTVPSAFTSTQAHTNGAAWGANTNTPNLLPDFIAKIAYDTKMGRRSIHLDAAGIYRTFKINTFVTATNTSPQINQNFLSSGAGASFNSNIELFHNFHLFENAFWSDGGGRYVLGLEPDFVVRPANSAGVYTISPVHTGSALVGYEWQAAPTVTLFGYYSGVYAGRNDSKVAPNTSCGSLGYCGFGFPGSSNASNREIEEATLGASHKFWHSPEIGTLLLSAQVSYLTRAPWAVAPGSPESANLIMTFLTLRYVLP
jgi:hypothetical protein